MIDTYIDPGPEVVLCQSCCGQTCPECEGSGFFVVDDGVRLIPWVGWQSDIGMSDDALRDSLLDQGMEADDRIESPFTVTGMAAAI